MKRKVRIILPVGDRIMLSAGLPKPPPPRDRIEKGVIIPENAEIPNKKQDYEERDVLAVGAETKMLKVGDVAIIHPNMLEVVKTSLGSICLARETHVVAYIRDGAFVEKTGR